MSTSWSQSVPKTIHVVIAGDRGGDKESNWTKIGLFIPDNVNDSQSPNNFLVLAAYDGPEVKDLLREGRHFNYNFF